MDALVDGRSMDELSEELMAASLLGMSLLLSGSEVVSSAIMSQGFVTGVMGVGDRGRKGGRRRRWDDRRMV